MIGWAAYAVDEEEQAGSASVCRDIEQRPVTGRQDAAEASPLAPAAVRSRGGRRCGRRPRSERERQNRAAPSAPPWASRCRRRRGQSWNRRAGSWAGFEVLLTAVGQTEPASSEREKASASAVTSMATCGSGPPAGPGKAMMTAPDRATAAAGSAHGTPAFPSAGRLLLPVEIIPHGGRLCQQRPDDKGTSLWLSAHVH